MSFKHVKAQKHVHRLLLEYRERGSKEILLDSHLHHVDTPYDSLDTNTFRYTCPSETR